MNKRFKLLSIVCTIILGTTLLITGCGEKIESPEVVAKAYYDMAVLGDSTKMLEYGLSKSEAKEILEEQRKISKDQTREEFERNGFVISEEQINEIVGALEIAKGKLAAKTELVSEDKNKASVKIITNYVNIQEAYDKAADDAAAEVQALELTDEEAANELYLKFYVNRIVKNLKNIKSSTETIENVFDFELGRFDVEGKTQKIWAPVNDDEIGDQLGKMISGQSN